MATKLAVISDLHLYSKKLGVAGRAYELRSGSDQKALAESGDVIESVFRSLAASDADAVLIVGDITNDGEAASHEEFLEKCLRLKEKKPVYLITSTHDWCSDGNPRRFEGTNVFTDVPAWGMKEINAAYDRFGKENEIARYRTRLGFYSRVFQVSETLRLIAVNDDADAEGGKSGYSEAHLAWMCDRIREAKAAGQDVIAMEHHLLLYGISSLINKSQSIGDNEKTAAALADAGLRLMLVGHSHMQRTTEYTSPAGNKITQINVGALCGYPAPVNWLTVENGCAQLQVERVQSFVSDGVSYGADFFKTHTENVLLNILRAAATDKEDLRERLGAHGIRIKPLNKIYPLLRFFAKKALRVKVGAAGRTVNFLTFGRGVDKKAVRELKNDRLMDHLLAVFLNVFDGSETAKTQPEAAKRITLDVASLPDKTVKRLPMKKTKKEKLLRLTGQIKETARALVYPAGPDGSSWDIKL